MTDVTTATAAATTTPAAPAPPATPSEAASRLAGLKEDQSWGAKVLAQDPGALSEFHTLSKLAAQADPIDLIMSGQAANLPNMSLDGKPSLATTAREIPALREAGISDGAIRELLEGRVPSAEEIDAVGRFRNLRHSSKEWVDRYLKGDAEARRESMLMSMVLMMAPS
jgi:hypothetical protein